MPSTGHDLDQMMGKIKLTPRPKVKGVVTIQPLVDGRFAVMVDGYVRQVYHGKERAVNLARILVGIKNKESASVPDFTRY